MNKRFPHYQPSTALRQAIERLNQARAVGLGQSNEGNRKDRAAGDPAQPGKSGGPGALATTPGQEGTGILERDGDEVDFTPEAIEAMGSLATAALRALDGEQNTQEGSGTAREASGGQPLAEHSGLGSGPGQPQGDIGDLQYGTQSAPHAYSTDERYIRAVAIVRETGKVSASLVSRRLGIGYSVATFLIEVMELDGIVTAPDDADQRKVLPEAANDCQQPPETDQRLSVAGPKDTAGRQSVDTLRAERGRPGDGVTAGETAPDFLRLADLREAYEGEVALLAPRLGKLSMAEAEAALRAGRAASVSPVLLAQDLGHPLGTVKTWLNRLGLTSLDHMNLMNNERAAAAQARKADQ